MLDFDKYSQVLRRKYHPKYVKKSFYKALAYIGGMPQDNERFAFVSVRLDKETNRWDNASSSMNAFEFRFNRKMFKKGMRPEFQGMMNSVKSIELNEDEGGYHWHILFRLNRLRVILRDDELGYILRNIANDLDEINTHDPTTPDIRFFNYDITKQNTREDAFGKGLHYLCKQASPTYQPLKNIVLPRIR